MKNKYVVRSRISENKFKEILKYFSLDLQANQIAEISGLSRNSINTYIKAIRVAIANQSSYNNNLQTDKKNILFGLIHRDNKIHIDMIPSILVTDILQLAKGKDNRDFQTEYTGIIDMAHSKYYQIKSSQSNYNDIHILDTASFWGYSKIRLAKFRGISDKNIFLHLKECEFRYNNRRENLYKLLLSYFRKTPLVL